MKSHFASVFREQRFSDADLCLQVLKPASDDATHSQPQEVIKFPVHLVVLTQSPYFASQVNFLSSSSTSQAATTLQNAAVESGRPQHTLPSSDSTLGSRKRLRLSIEVIEEDEEGARHAAGARAGSGRCSSSRLEVVLTLDDQSHEAATMAVIAAMYGVEDALSTLQQPQLVYAVKYADMLQMASTTEAALGLLITAAETPQGLTEDTLASLASLPVWPSCMFTLLPKVAQGAVLDVSKLGTPATQTDSRNASIQAVLATVLGQLENVWQQQELTDLLLGLPLAAISLLLSSDKLTMYSEDTVLYTACKFVAQRAGAQKADAVEHLSALIRVPQLSDFQLMVQAMTRHPLEIDDVLGKHVLRIQQLLSLKRFELSNEELLAHLQRKISAAPIPQSWACGSRQILAVPLSGVKMTWEVSVEKVKAATLRCQETKTTQRIASNASPPLAGLEWTVGILCSHCAEANGVQVGLLVVVSYPCSNHKHAFCKYDCHLQVPSIGFESQGATPAPLPLSICKWGRNDGWDEAAWVATGLPASGGFDVILGILRVY